MKLVISRRAVADLDRLFKDGVQRFGLSVAGATFLTIDRVLRLILTNNPRVGRYFPGRDLYRYVVAGTPFVIYYRVSVAAGELRIVAILHGAQDRAEFEAD